MEEKEGSISLLSETYSDMTKGKDESAKTKKTLILSNGSDEEMLESDNGLAELAISLALFTKQFEERFGKKSPFKPNSI
ncbi:hypothetical protein L1987_46981 [Smallanthus sonchifolius]|uniref:Uncharacterized protein n=1 Tax=Smallanthus sonchifolius TaxID=185202 RepID=A0ACB9G2A2_9ASTR|nr:hypothetical protein L1987_46981 [Smallanthus sonchifolius]